VDPDKFSVVSTESLGSAGDLYELQQVSSGGDKTYVASINFESTSSRSVLQLVKKLRNDSRLLNGTLLISAKYNNTKFKELMAGRVDLPKDKSLFTYVHRMNQNYETSVIKGAFRGGGKMTVPSAMRVYRNASVPTVVSSGGGKSERPLYYGIKLTGESTMSSLGERHTFVGVSHDKPMTQTFDTHLTFRTDSMTSYIKKKDFEVIQAVFEDTGRCMHAVYGKNSSDSTTVLYININIDVDHKNILNAVLDKLDKMVGTPDTVVIVGTFAQKYGETIKPFETLGDITLSRVDVYSRDPKVCTYKR
jgi:hypothetical protein